MMLCVSGVDHGPTAASFFSQVATLDTEVTMVCIMFNNLGYLSPWKLWQQLVNQSYLAKCK